MDTIKTILAVSIVAGAFWAFSEGHWAIALGLVLVATKVHKADI